MGEPQLDLAWLFIDTEGNVTELGDTDLCADPWCQRSHKVTRLGLWRHDPDDEICPHPDEGVRADVYEES